MKGHDLLELNLGGFTEKLLDHANCARLAIATGTVL